MRIKDWELIHSGLERMYYNEDLDAFVGTSEEKTSDYLTTLVLKNRREFLKNQNK